MEHSDDHDFALDDPTVDQKWEASNPGTPEILVNNMMRLGELSNLLEGLTHGFQKLVADPGFSPLVPISPIRQVGFRLPAQDHDPSPERP